MNAPERRVPASQLAARRLVWGALSTLYLDTDVSLDRKWRTRVLAASPYSLEELETILWEEVRPVCITNMFSLAGEWAGFDIVWLECRILYGEESLISKLVARLWRKVFGAGGEWRATRRGIIAARSQEGPPA